MKLKLPIAVALPALALALAGQSVAAQNAGASLYSFHTGSFAGCPGLDWHITVEPDNTLSGFVAWDRMQHMARLEGKLNPNRSFELDAKEVGGTGRTATVTGTATGEYINAMIEGSGTACDGRNLAIPRVANGVTSG